jgi:hypothetical protein
VIKQDSLCVEHQGAAFGRLPYVSSGRFPEVAAIGLAIGGVVHAPVEADDI